VPQIVRRSMSMVEGERGSPQRPLPAHVPKALPHMRSRWFSGPSTFGPFGRICWTGITFLIPAQMVYMALVGGLVGIVIGVAVCVTWVGWFVPLMLKDIWAEDTYYVPVPPIPEVKSMTTWDGKPILTLEDYVATQGRPETQG
jgi:hypothetical protein